MPESEFPFTFPERPRNDAPMQETLQYAIGVLEVAVQLTEPDSPRTQPLTSLIRFLEGAKEVLNNVESGDSPLHTLAAALEWRDRARAEQQWIDQWLQDEQLVGEQLDAVIYYKVRLARLESAAIVSIGYVDTELEGKRKTGGWWARQVGKALTDLTKVGTALMILPGDNQIYSEFKARYAATIAESLG